MRKLTQKQKMHHTRRARKQNLQHRWSGRRRSNWSVHTVSMWYRGAAWRARLSSAGTVRSFPKSMCFLKEPELTLEAFEYIRKGLHRNTTNRLWFRPSLDGRKEVKVKGYVSMHDVEEISTSAALVLAAEYERKRMSMDESSPIFGVEKWDAKLLHKLDQIGFFKGFGYQLPTIENDAVYADVVTVPFYSGTSSEMEKVDKKLLKLVEHIDQDFQIGDEMLIALNSAVGEAATNTREHAYNEYHKFKYPHVNRWWATGAASASERRIVVSLYDQGVTIPISYPRLGFFKEIVNKLSLFDPAKGSKYANDAKLIQAAAMYGNSGRKIASGGGHNNKIGGFGLPQIKDAINLCGGGSLMILSRGGRYIYQVRDGVPSEQLDTYECSIGGTLIEWTVTLPEPEFKNG